MILTQKYHSVSEIDEEFIPGLENLLQDYFPSFNWLIKREKLEPESTHFTYFLFFGNKHNAPVGFAGLSIKKSDEQSPWYKKLLKSNKDSLKVINWSTPGPGEEAFFFDPLYIKDGVTKSRELIKNYFERKDISWQSLTFSKAFSGIQESFAKNLSASSEKKVADTFIKSGNSYQHYLSERSQKMQDKIKLDWKILSTKYDLDIGDYNTFKSVFEYRKNGQLLYKELKKDSKVQININEKTHFITFETHDEVQAILFLIRGFRNHLFFDWKIFNENITSEMMIQLAVMKFYELEDVTFLHSLTEQDLSKSLEGAGFSGKNLLQVNFRKLK